MTDIKYGWHILPGNGMLNYGGKVKLRNNVWYSVKGYIDMCNNGLHASKTLRGAVRYWYYANVGMGDSSAYICRVAFKGDISLNPSKYDDEYNWDHFNMSKYVARSRKIIWRIPAEKIVSMGYSSSTASIRKTAIRIAKKLDVYREDK